MAETQIRLKEQSRPGSHLLGSVSLTGQTADINTTTIATLPATGVYRATVYQVITSAGSTGTLTTTLNWTDLVGNRSATPGGALSVLSTGQSNGSVIFQGENGSAVTYSTDLTSLLGSPAYAVYISLERLF